MTASPRLSKRQREVLRAVEARTGTHPHLPAVEFYIWRTGREAGWWGGLALHGHLKKLMDRGYLKRSGRPGGYDYALTDAGRAALRDSAGNAV